MARMKSPKHWTKAQRLAGHTNKQQGCWLWTGSKNDRGYGHITIDGKTYYAHRLAYAETFGAIPRGLQVCHSCDVRLCVQPSHLFLGTNQDNVDDCRRKDRHNRGERNGQAVLTAATVRAIRRAGGKHKDIAAKFGVSRPYVSTLRAHKRWRHV